jgi:hypothetical protein
MQGLRDEYYILASMHMVMTTPHGEVLNVPLPLKSWRMAYNTPFMIEINLGSDTFVSASLTPKECEDYRQIFMQYHDCFTWSYTEMLGLDPRCC